VVDEVGSNWRVWLDELGNILKELIALPSQMGRLLTQAERGELNVQVPQVTRQVVYLERAINRLTGGIVFAALLIGGVLFYNAGNILLAGVSWGGSAISLLWIIFFARGHRPRR
jgi:hypothetical protein